MSPDALAGLARNVWSAQAQIVSEWLNSTRLGRFVTACCWAVVYLVAWAVWSLIGGTGALFWVDLTMRLVGYFAAFGAVGYLLGALLGPTFHMDSQE
jgi:hypothetical protein